MTVRPFRFGAKAVKATSAKEWTDLVRQAEDLGYASFHDGRPLRQPAGPGAGADGRGRRHVDASWSAPTWPASTSATRCCSPRSAPPSTC